MAGARAAVGWGDASGSEVIGIGVAFAKRQSCRRRAGYTVIELITVCAILAVLGAIGFGVMGAFQDRAKVARAKSDLQVIQVGLEKYRTRFGDYPRLPDFGGEESSIGLSGPNAYLLNALSGWRAPGNAKINAGPMLQYSALSFELPTLPLQKEVENRIIDPWENEYIYDYRPDADEWKVFGYVLYSTGEDKDNESDDIYAK